MQSWCDRHGLGEKPTTLPYDSSRYPLDHGCQSAAARTRRVGVPGLEFRGYSLAVALLGVVCRLYVRDPGLTDREGTLEPRGGVPPRGSMPSTSANLPQLQFDQTRRVPVQQTTFLRDSLSRFVCNTWDEATWAVRSSSAEVATSAFDAIVVGAGMYGAYCAHQVWRRGGKVLLLEAGPFFLPEHGQNLARGFNFNPAEAVLPESVDAQRARNEILGLPWRGNQIFPGMRARDNLARTYERVELQLGVTTQRPPTPSADRGCGPATFSSYRWQSHCRGLHQTPMAA